MPPIALIVVPPPHLPLIVTPLAMEGIQQYRLSRGPHPPSAFMYLASYSQHLLYASLRLHSLFLLCACWGALPRSACPAPHPILLPALVVNLRGIAYLAPVFLSCCCAFIDDLSSHAFASVSPQSVCCLPVLSPLLPSYILCTSSPYSVLLG